MKTLFRHLLFCLPLLIPAARLSAQDIILKTDNSVIVSKVEEIDEASIKYHEWSNLDGPLYHISISNVQKIQFANGTEQDFRHRQNMNGSPYIPTAKYSGKFTYKSRGSDFYYGVRKLEEDEVCNIIGSDIYEQTYVGAQTQRKAGIVLSSVGGGLLGICLVLSLTGVNMKATDYYSNYMGCFVGAICTGMAGFASLSTGITLAVISNKRLNWIESYVRERDGGYAATLSLSSNNGIGLTLNF